MTTICGEGFDFSTEPDMGEAAADIAACQEIDDAVIASEDLESIILDTLLDESIVQAEGNMDFLEVSCCDEPSVSQPAVGIDGLETNAIGEDSSVPELQPLPELEVTSPEAGELPPSGLSPGRAVAFGGSPAGFHTGDSDLDRLLSEAQQARLDSGYLASLPGLEPGNGAYLSIDDALQRGGSQGLSDFIQQRLDWMEHASPDDLRQYAHQVDWEHESEMARLHMGELQHEQGELAERFIKHQTEEQFNAEKQGYHQVYPSYISDNWDKDHNLFEKDGELFRLIPGTGGEMESISST